MKFSSLSPAASRLQEAITTGRIFQTRLLLEDGLDLNFVDEEGLNPLLRACLIEDEKRRTRTSLIRLLLQHGVDVNATDANGRHALIVACVLEKEDIVHLLLDASIHNIDLNLQDLEGNTALMYAARSGNAAIVHLLVEALNKFELNIDVRNNQDYTPYLEAKRLGKAECIRILAAEGRASKYIEVNPFLDFFDVKENDDGRKGTIQSVRSVKESAHQGINVRQNKPRHIATDPKGNGLKRQTKRVLERKVASPAKCEIKIQDDTVNESEIKLAWHEGFDLKAKQGGSTQLLKGEKFNSSARSVTRLNRNGNAETTTENSHDRVEAVIPLQNARDKPVLSVEDVSFSHARPSSSSSTASRKYGVVTRKANPSSPRTRSAALESSQDTFFVTCPAPMSGKEAVVSPSGRLGLNTRAKPQTSATSRTKRSFSLQTVDSAAGSEISWHTHFSTQTSTSAAFIHNLMNIYADQVSPQSSYRCGVRLEPNSALGTGPEDMDDVRSESGKSSCGSRSRAGSVHAGTLVSARPPSRKFSKTVASFLNNKRAMATIAMLRTGIKDGSTV